MPVKRELWNEPLSEKYTPSWHCPACSGGYLRVEPQTLRSVETKESRAAHDHEAWDPDWIQSRFTALLKCNNEACQDPVTVAGRARVEMVQTGPTAADYVEFFYPEYVSPSPPLIQIPDDCPVEVVAELKRAFIASWGDFPATVNRIRAAVERLLDFLKEPKTTMNKKGHRERLSLHERIISLGTRDKDLSDSLLAVKWLGNVGSHTDSVSRDDVFDAFDILELVLDELFVKHRERVKKLVTAINRKKGPARVTKAKAKKTK